MKTAILSVLVAAITLIEWYHSDFISAMILLMLFCVVYVAAQMVEVFLQWVRSWPDRKVISRENF